MKWSYLHFRSTCRKLLSPLNSQPASVTSTDAASACQTDRPTDRLHPSPSGERLMQSASGARNCPISSIGVANPSCPGTKSRYLSRYLSCALDAICGSSGTAVADKTQHFQWPGPELNWRHTDFQSVALPTELPGREGNSLGSEAVCGKAVRALPVKLCRRNRSTPSSTPNVTAKLRHSSLKPPRPGSSRRIQVFAL